MQTQSQTRRQKPLLVPHAPAGEEARVDAVLSAVENHLGFVPDGLKLYSLSPPLLETFVGNVSYFNSGERLSPALMTMIRYLVSNHSECQFCIDMNEAMLTNMGHSLDTIRATRNDANLAPLPVNEKALLKLALKSIATPDGVTQKDVDDAKALGWSERDIFDVVAQAASNRAFNYVLRTFKVESQGVFA